MLELLLGALVVGGVAATAISFLCDSLSDLEIEKQNSMRAEYAAYKSSRLSMFNGICAQYDTLINIADEAYVNELNQFRLEQIQKLKKDNRIYYNKCVGQYKERRKDQENLLDTCKSILLEVSNNKDELQNSYLRYNSIKAQLLQLEEAHYKLEAYIRYLDEYFEKLSNTYEDSGEIIPPFNFLLPEDYPYEGKIFFLNKEDFKLKSYINQDGITKNSYSYRNIRLSQFENNIFEIQSSNKPLPFMSYSYNSIMYFSLAKGMIKNSIGGTIGFSPEVIENRKNTIFLRFLDQEYPHIRLNKNDMINPNLRTPLHSSLVVFVKSYDFALKNEILVTDKIGESLAIENFDSICLLATPEEGKKFQDFISQKNYLNEPDDWKIAPIFENDKLKSIKMQNRMNYVIKASFITIQDDKLILHYDELLSDEDFITFNEVFISTKVQCHIYWAERVLTQSDLFNSYVEEIQRFFLYLNTEFLTQAKMLEKNPMSIYLKKWEAVTDRLIEKKMYCQFVTVKADTIIPLEDLNKLIIEITKTEQIEKLIQRVDLKYAIFGFHIHGYDDSEKKLCKLKINEDIITIISETIPNDVSEVMVENNFLIDLYLITNTTVERRQKEGLRAFKEGRCSSNEVKLSIINPAATSFIDNNNRIVSFYNRNIISNEAQKNAVIRSFASKDFFIIQGPPGTGKTTVIKELVFQQLNLCNSSKILIVSQANVAVDNVIRGIENNFDKIPFISSSQIIRCGSEEKISNDISKYSYENRFEEYKKELQSFQELDDKSKSLRKEWISLLENKDNSNIVGEYLLSGFQIIGVTCVGLANKNYGLSNIDFDLVIIDEAGKALPGELIIPINHAKKLIIIGDHKQLPPVVDTLLYKNNAINSHDSIDIEDIVEDAEREDFLNKSFFERLYELCPNEKKIMLNIQFRMPPVIANLVNMFYDNQLKTGENCYAKVPLFLNNNLILVDMSDISEYEEINEPGKSPVNKFEPIAVEKIIVKLQKYYKDRIVVITPYKGQKFLIIKHLREYKIENVVVNTIDAFQGDEENVVIYCTTRSKKKTKYFSDSARLNVAFSRAKNTLIMIASQNYLSLYDRNSIMGKVSGYLSNNARIISYNDWNNDNLDLHFQKQAQSKQGSDLSDSGEKRIEDIKKTNDILFNSIKKEEKYCLLCHNTLQGEEDILCIECLQKSKKIKCNKCNEYFDFSNYLQFIKKVPVPKICDKCRVKENSFVENIVCNNCKKPFIKYKEYTYMEKNNKAIPTFCRDCSNKTVVVNICKACKKEILVPIYLLELKPHLKEQIIHKECKNKIYKTYKCCDCGENFNVTWGELDYLAKKDFYIPIRCKKCRKKKNDMFVKF